MDSLPYRPVVSLLDLLKQLYDARPAPCPGLMLPEAVQVLKMFYQGEDVSGCLSRLLTWREEAIASIPDEAKAAIDDEESTQRARVCLLLADDVVPIDLCRVSIPVENSPKVPVENSPFVYKYNDSLVALCG